MSSLEDAVVETKKGEKDSKYNTGNWYEIMSPYELINHFYFSKRIITNSFF